jgi:hypothetical protein
MEAGAARGLQLGRERRTETGNGTSIETPLFYLATKSDRILLSQRGPLVKRFYALFGVSESAPLFFENFCQFPILKNQKSSLKTTKSHRPRHPDSGAGVAGDEGMVEAPVAFRLQSARPVARSWSINGARGILACSINFPRDR